MTRISAGAMPALFLESPSDSAANSFERPANSVAGTAVPAGLGVDLSEPRGLSMAALIGGDHTSYATAGYAESGMARSPVRLGEPSGTIAEAAIGPRNLVAIHSGAQ